MTYDDDRWLHVRVVDKYVTDILTSGNTTKKHFWRILDYHLQTPAGNGKALICLLLRAAKPEMHLKHATTPRGRRRHA